MYTHKHTRGFTLIELLVVIAIIGVLSSVVLASLNTARQKSRDAKRQSDIKQLQIALELAFDSNGAYPILTTSGGTDVVTTGGTANTTLTTALVTGGFIAALPRDPLSTTRVYKYESNAGGTAYCVGASLEGSTGTLDTCGTPDTLAAGYTYKVGP